MEKDNNELIAEFMGGKWETISWGGVPTPAFHFPDWHITDWPTTIHAETFQYHTSWDWLMPVVKKIGDLYPFDFGSRHEITRLHSLSLFASIEKVYAAVVEFIRWYNESNKPT